MNRRVLWILLVASTLGCGVTRKDMEAQIAKYNQLSQQYEQEKAAHAATRAELEATQARVLRLTADLKEMGLDMDSLAAQGVDVVVEYLLQMDQPALARAVLPVLQSGQSDGFGGIHAIRASWRGGV